MAPASARNAFHSGNKAGNLVHRKVRRRHRVVSAGGPPAPRRRRRLRRAIQTAHASGVSKAASSGPLVKIPAEGWSARANERAAFGSASVTSPGFPDEDACSRLARAYARSFATCAASAAPCARDRAAAFQTETRTPPPTPRAPPPSCPAPAARRPLCVTRPFSSTRSACAPRGARTARRASCSPLLGRLVGERAQHARRGTANDALRGAELVPRTARTRTRRGCSEDAARTCVLGGRPNARISSACCSAQRVRHRDARDGDFLAGRDVSKSDERDLRTRTPAGSSAEPCAPRPPISTWLFGKQLCLASAAAGASAGAATSGTTPPFAPRSRTSSSERHAERRPKGSTGSPARLRVSARAKMAETRRHAQRRRLRSTKKRRRRRRRIRLVVARRRRARRRPGPRYGEVPRVAARAARSDAHRARSRSGPAAAAETAARVRASRGRKTPR